MKPMIQHTMQPQQSNHSLIEEAFVVLLEHLGPEKTLQLWHLFMPPQDDYVTTRHNLFAGTDVAGLAQEARKFNRE